MRRRQENGRKLTYIELEVTVPHERYVVMPHYYFDTCTQCHSFPVSH